MSWQLKKRWRFLGLACVLALAAGVAALHAQNKQTLYLLAFDKKGFAVTDIKAAELQFVEKIQEKETPGTVVSVEPYKWPLKVTVLVDNGVGGVGGTDGFDNLTQYRSGLKAFFKTLPPDVEVTLIATAPNPRYLVRPSTDEVQILKGVDLLSPENEAYGRFTEALEEYAARLDAEFKRLTTEERQPYIPVLVVIGTTGQDGGRIEPTRVTKMIESLRNYGTWTNFIMVSAPASTQPENEGGTVLIAKAVQETTGGSYFPLAGSSATRVTTLLPELAQKIAARHLKQTLQYRVTLERPEGATGPMGPFGIKLTREGVSYLISANGTYP